MNVGQTPGLLGHCTRHQFDAMAYCYDGCAARSVQIPAAIGSDDEAAFAADSLRICLAEISRKQRLGHDVSLAIKRCEILANFWAGHGVSGSR